MAIDYYLSIRRTTGVIDSGEVRDALLASSLLTPNPLSSILGGKGLSVSVFDEERAPGVTVAFRIDKFDEHATGIDGMLRLVDLVLRRFEGDASLTLDLDDVLLQRTGGQLTFAEDPDLWTPARRAVITQER